MSASAADPSILEQAGPALIGVLATAVLGIVATYVGRRWEREHSQAEWLRDRRHEAAVELVAQATMFWTLVALVSAARDTLNNDVDEATDPPDVVDLARTIFLDNREAMHGAFAALVSATSSVRVLGPDDLVAKADDLFLTLREAATAAPERDQDIGFPEYDRCREAFETSARATLGG
jgi:hypothetical protein